MDFVYGEPLGDYYSVGGDLYRRDFTEKIIFANISPSSTYTVTVGGQTYQLPPTTGLILEN